MQLGSFDNTIKLPRVVRRPRARDRARAKPGSVANRWEIPSSNVQDLAEPYDTDANANAWPKGVQADENRQSLPLFYIPKRRAISPYRPGSDRADLRLRELIHHCMSVLYTPKN